MSGIRRLGLGTSHLVVTPRDQSRLVRFHCAIVRNILPVGIYPFILGIIQIWNNHPWTSNARLSLLSQNNIESNILRASWFDNYPNSFDCISLQSYAFCDERVLFAAKHLIIIITVFLLMGTPTAVAVKILATVSLVSLQNTYSLCDAKRCHTSERFHKNEKNCSAELFYLARYHPRLGEADSIGVLSVEMKDFLYYSITAVL